MYFYPMYMAPRYSVNPPLLTLAAGGSHCTEPNGCCCRYTAHPEFSARAINYNDIRPENMVCLPRDTTREDHLCDPLKPCHSGTLWGDPNCDGHCGPGSTCMPCLSPTPGQRAFYCTLPESLAGPAWLR